MTLEQDPSYRPRLRPLEPMRLPDEDGEMMFALRGPTGISEAILGVSGGALQAMLLMDGRRTCAEIREEFGRSVGVELSADALRLLLTHLERAHFLDGEAFESHYRVLADAYRHAPARRVRDVASLGVDAASGEPFRSMLNGAAVAQAVQPVPDAAEDAAERDGRAAGRVVGLVAPHLDYRRGAPCYRAAYAALAGQPAPPRVVILGTNHFGRSASVVATSKAFETPLGTTACDVEFLESLESRLGTLRQFELDHRREHSVELQVMFLQYLYGATNFRIVPFLCPDPCGPTGTAPILGDGVDLRHFAESLGEQLRAAGDTLVIAGADFSHVGGYFGDARELDEPFLAEVRQHDAAALRHVESGDAEAFRTCLAERENPTRVCSAGCVYALLTALPKARVRVLEYHQAVTREWNNCVTCAAAVLHEPSPWSAE